MSETKPREWPWSEFPEDTSTWNSCVERYDKLAAELAKANEVADEWKSSHLITLEEYNQCRQENINLRQERDEYKAALESAKSLARHIIETAKKDGWTSSGLEFGCSKVEQDISEALQKWSKPEME